MSKRSNVFMRQRARYTEQMSVLKLLMICILGLVASFILIIVWPATNKFFATPDRGRTQLQLVAMKQPSLTQDFVMRWVTVAVREAYNFNFENFDGVVNSIQSKFTSSGYSAFKSALENSGLLATIKSKQLIMSAIVPSDPELLYKGEVSGHFTWIIRLPLLLNFESASVPAYKTKTWVTVTVTRVSSLVAPLSGIQISSFTS